MPFTAEDFLDALHLPEEHPYAFNGDNLKREILKPWSVGDYFRSISSETAALNYERLDEYIKFPSIRWGNDFCDGRTEQLGHYRKKSMYAEKRLTTRHRHYSESNGSCLIFPMMTQRNKVSKGSSSSEVTNQRSGIRGNKTVDVSILPFFEYLISILYTTRLIFSIEDKSNDQHAILDKTHESIINHHCSVASAENNNQCTGTGDPLCYIIALIVSAVMMTDAMYILEFSQSTLIGLHILIISIGIKRMGLKVALLTALPITSVSYFVMRHQELDLPTIQPGLYYSDKNPLVSNAVKMFWHVESHTYEDMATPWMITGDTRTGLPFLLYSSPSVKYTRRWVPLSEENEAVILDIALPESHTIEDDRTVFLLVHGINGHSNEGYILDFVRRQVAEGNIVAVVVTRGLMDSPVLGNNLLHFARTSDIAAAAKALKRALLKIKDSHCLPMLVGVGFSMGAITLANYVARAGKEDCYLDIAIGFSGALDTREQIKFRRSERLWQPFITKAMRDTLVGKFAKQIENKFNLDQFYDMMTAESLVDLDRAFFAPYNGFTGLLDYYSNIGAMGDFESFEGKQGRIANVSIPLFMVHSLDDPVGTWRSFHDPAKVAETGSGNTLILLTRKGGHVGWPLGLNPRLHGWRWMSDVASSFVYAISQACDHMNTVVL